MSFYAKVNEDNIVTDIVYLSEDNEPNAKLYLSRVLGVEGEWVDARMSINSANYANIGSVYLPEHNAFISPKIFNSWVVKQNNVSKEYYWDAPVDFPTDNKNYTWDEDSLSWVETEPAE